MSTPIVSRGPMGLFAAIAAGGVSVGFLLVALLHANTMLMFLAYLAAIPLYIAGLGAGALAGLVATVAGTLALYVTQPPNFAALYVMVYGVPAMVVTRLALKYRMADDQQPRWYPEGRLLTVLSLYPCILFLIFAAVATSHPGGLLDLTQAAFEQFSTQFAAKFDNDQAELFRQAIASIARIMPALAGYTWIFIMILSLGGAQHILRQQKMNLRDGFFLQRLHVPSPLIYGVAATGLIGAFAPAPFDYIGRNLAMILGLPFFFVGLAVAHALAATVRYPAVMLVVFYGLMIFMPWIALIVTALGVIDQWVNFRQRLIALKTTAL